MLALHGTDESVARKIVDNGFATVSSLDAGYYGAGMYFSSNADYIQPYFGTKKSPAILISLVTPGTSLN
jgi:hypothetical protein